MSASLGPLWVWLHTERWRVDWTIALTPKLSADFFASRRAVQFRVVVRSWQFHISTSSGIYIWPTARHHLPRWGFIRKGVHG